MPWFKVDDQFWSHPKVVELSADAVALWVRAGSYAAQHLTDGIVTYGIVRMLGADRDAATELTNACLWDQRDGRTWVFHDWEDYQPDAVVSKDRRQKKQDASALGNHDRWHVARGIQVEGCLHCIAGAIPPAIPGATPEGLPGGFPPSPSPSPDSSYVSESQSRDTRANGRTDDQTGPYRSALASQYGIDVEKVRRHLDEKLGLLLESPDVVNVSMWILNKIPQPPRAPTSYVIGAITKSPAEVQQYIHESALV